MAEPGKKFQDDFKDSAEKDGGISVDRIRNTTPGFKSINNYCDTIIYKYPLIYFLELKSHLGKTLPFSAIRDNQIDGLTNKVKIPGAMPGILIQFRDLGLHYFIHISDINERIYRGDKSISVKDCELIGVPLNGKKKRVTWVFDVAQFCEDMYDHYFNKRYEGMKDIDDI